MTNEDRFAPIEIEQAMSKINRSFPGTKGDVEARNLIRAALRSPAPGAVAMREKAASECDALEHDFKIEADDAERKGLFNQENDYAMRSYGARACAAAIRALPAPEVPEVHPVPEQVRAWVRSPGDFPVGSVQLNGLLTLLRDWIRKEYGL